MSASHRLPEKVQKTLESCVERLKNSIGPGLESVVLYGSAVRGGYQPGVSDINLLIVLEDSIPAIHAAIADVLSSTKLQIEPFIVSRRGFERSQKAFAIKFQSILRQHLVLHGTSPFVGIKIEPHWVKFLSEQALRNLRLRTTRAFVVFGRDRRRYSHFLGEVYAGIFVDLSEPLRCETIEVPDEFADRIVVFEKVFGLDASVLNELIAFHDAPHRLSRDEILSFHSRLFAILDQVIIWMENRWPNP